ncbi:MAG: hypothetical protein A2033_14415 [Bacteroidetes bacterium GWA2_31_9]|nr:MAG: hypothetical protein A2033_14415 [Bacteroidetes bacterium GWA2_31_9]
MQKNIFILAIAFFIVNNLFGQTFNMSNTYVNTCTGKFYDDGGLASSYSANANIKMTICSDLPNREISVHFNSFDIENSYEFLTVYNGDSALAMYMFDSVTGTSLNGVTIQSIGTGCLTFVFTSDGSIQNSGWDADIECVLTCQDFSNSITVSSGSVNNSEISLCNNMPFYINLYGIYNNNDITYHQSDSTSIFEFAYNSNIYFGNNIYIDNIDSNSNHAVLTITDTNGCYISEYYTINFLPMININISSSNDTILLGDSIVLNANFFSDTIISQINNIFINNNVFFIPDGSGVSYESIINVNSNYNNNILDTNMIKSVCINMEHSYSGDTDIELKCPNGQSVLLKENSGSATFLGEPIDDDVNNIAGVGYDYCFTQISPIYGNMTNEANLYKYTFTDLAGNIYTDQDYFPSSTYLPINNFIGLIGCPVNGNWTLKVTDNISSDNGYIFNWGLTFDFSLFDMDTVFSTVFNSFWSEGNGSIIGSDSLNATGLPLDTGLFTYYYNTITNDGCTYTDSIIIFVDNVVFSEKLFNTVNSLNIYPVPTDKELYMQLDLIKPYDVNIEISDISGKIIKTLSFKNLQAGNNTVKEFIDFENGIYFLKIQIENESMTRKIIKL